LATFILRHFTEAFDVRYQVRYEYDRWLGDQVLRFPPPRAIALQCEPAGHFERLARLAYCFLRETWEETEVSRSHRIGDASNRLIAAGRRRVACGVNPTATFSDPRADRRIAPILGRTVVISLLCEVRLTPD
jgi:hypothetical protein